MVTEDLLQIKKTHREDELILRKRKYKIESEVENWIHKYDAEMEEKQTELDEITVILSQRFELDNLIESRLFMWTSQINCKVCKLN